MRRARIVAGALVEGDDDAQEGNAGSWINTVLMLEEVSLSFCMKRNRGAWDAGLTVALGAKLMLDLPKRATRAAGSAQCSCCRRSVCVL